ncbi:hypothetical protein LWI29_037903 [Acer saccharum]|uniref:Apple domain-containing protein n=1 Tax=Acer saccharum TaxID=4024 RepID=A0AA39T637_ACESA|nr:hypothetical protein LWI29_037903 [Acer saccharum]
MQIDPHGSPQLVLKKGPELVLRAGSWNGLHWTGAPTLKPNSVYSYDFVSNEKEVSYVYYIHDSSVLSRTVMNQSGLAQRFTWINQTRTWAEFYAKMRDECDNYAQCGAYAICNINNFPVCTCFETFKPKSEQQWNVLNWTAGCVRKAPLDCQRGDDGFLKIEALKLPDTSHSRAEKTFSLVECEKSCLKNCSCTAYAALDIVSGSGCLLWFTDLMDIKEILGGQDLYVRIAASELGKIESRRQPSWKKNVIIIVASIISVMGALVLVWIMYMRKLKHRNEEPKNKASYSSWSENTFLKRSINVVPCLWTAALIEEEYYESAGGEILVDNDGWLATHGKPKDSLVVFVLARKLKLNKITDPEPNIFSFEQFLIQCMVMVKSVLECKEYKTSLTGRVIDENGVTLEQRKKNISNVVGGVLTSLLPSEQIVLLCNVLIRRRMTWSIGSSVGGGTIDPSSADSPNGGTGTRLIRAIQAFQTKWNATEMWEKLRGKRLMFVGDSLNRGQWISMVFLLQSVIPENKRSMMPNALTDIRAEEYNATVEFLWAPLLVESNSDDPVNHRLDERIIRPDPVLKHASKWEHASKISWWFYIEIWKGKLNPSCYDFLIGKYIETDRAGSWNGLHWTGAPTLKPNSVYSYDFVSNEKEVSYVYYIHDSPVLSRTVMNQSGLAQRFTWINQTRTWAEFYAKMHDECDNYAQCGAYAICNINNFPVCTCFETFKPKSEQQWNVLNWTAGCVRKAPLDCQRGDDGFLKIEALKLPDTSHSRAEKNFSLVECEKSCLKNCSCTAYAALDIVSGSGCLLWFTDLMDIKEILGGQDLYVRIAASELVLEIISGKRNRGFCHSDHNLNLLGHAWRLWNEERVVELIDKSLDYSAASSEILRYIHVGLLCVQQGPEDRPNMSSVVVMLSSEGSLPQPKQPGFFTERNLPESESSSSKHLSSSTNEVTISMLQPR